MVPPPTPFHILRAHASPLAALAFNPYNTILYAGDQDGIISITDLRTRRMICCWKGHDGGVLSLVEWEGRLISHGRDNLINFYNSAPSLGSLSSATGPTRPAPSVESSLTTNALNFCRFSFCPIPATHRQTNGQGSVPSAEALLAVPNLVDSELVDIYLLPSKIRLHASLNFIPRLRARDTGSIKPEEGRTGLIMGIHLAFDESGRLTCVMGYEDGRVELWRCGDGSEGGSQSWRTTWDARMSMGEPLWTKIWEAKGHNEAIMGLTVDPHLHRTFTVSADHLIVRYDLRPYTVPHEASSLVAHGEGSAIKSFSTGQIGNASIAVSHDGNVVAVGGWDGKIRLFSTSSLKPLGTLSYHRETVHCVAFANPPLENATAETEAASTVDIGGEEDSDEDDLSEERFRWLASGGKDNRIALWALKRFSS